MASPELTNVLSPDAQAVIKTYENPDTRTPTIDKFSKVESLIKFYADSPKGFKALNFIFFGIPRLIYRIRINALLSNHIKETDRKVKELEVILSEESIDARALQVLCQHVAIGLKETQPDVNVLYGLLGEKTLSSRIRAKIRYLKTNHIADSRICDELNKRVTAELTKAE